jgi:Protein of unknown function (DUF2785)
MRPPFIRLQSTVVFLAILGGFHRWGQAATPHDAAFWNSIVQNKFAVPAGESAGLLTLEIADLAASPDPVLRDDCGYEILAAWIYRDHRLSPNQLEALRRKLLPGMLFHIGESNNDTIFERSFSALYLSIVAAEDLKTPFLSRAGFQETLDAALRCYAQEKDLRGYVPGKGWAHATAHVADLLKFLGRNDKISIEQQRKIVGGIVQRLHTANQVFVWGEDARMAAALLSLTNRKDFDPAGFREWFGKLVPENRRLWKAPHIDPQAYARVRAQANVLAHLSAQVAAQKSDRTAVANDFKVALYETLMQVD